MSDIAAYVVSARDLSKKTEDQKFEEALANLGSCLDINDSGEAVRLARAIFDRFSSFAQKSKILIDREAQATAQQAKGLERKARSTLLESALDGTLKREWVRRLAKLRSEIPNTDTVHYDYLLVDQQQPITTFRQFVQKTLYVGKGQGQRALDHVKKAMIVPYEDYPIQTRKTRKIINILRNGGRLAIYVFNKGASDDLSKICEYSLVCALGLRHLANLDDAKVEVADEYSEYLEEIGCALLHEARLVNPILVKASNWRSSEVLGLSDDEEEVLNPTSKDSRSERLRAMNLKRGLGDVKSGSSSPEVAPKKRSGAKKTSKKQKKGY